MTGILIALVMIVAKGGSIMNCGQFAKFGARVAEPAATLQPDAS